MPAAPPSSRSAFCRATESAATADASDAAGAFPAACSSFAAAFFSELLRRKVSSADASFRRSSDSGANAFSFRSSFASESGFASARREAGAAGCDGA